MSKTRECGKCGRNNPPHRRKCQAWNCRERGPGQEDGRYWDCGCGCESNFASRSRCRSCGVVRGRYQQQQVQSSRKPQFTQSTFAAVVAEEAAKLYAQLGQGTIDVPMMETGPDVAPSEDAEREQLRTLLVNLDASIAALTPVAAGDEDGYQILQAKQEKRKRSRLSSRPVQGVGRGGGVRHGSALGQAEADPACEGGQRRQGKGARRGGGEKCKRRQCTEYADFFNQVIFTNEPSAVGGWATECAGRGGEGELQPVARAIWCPGASVFASTTASPNPGGDAVALLAFSFTAKRDNFDCRSGGAQCRDDIDWECKGRRQWATFSARVEIPTILRPERGLEMLTAVQWRQKLGLTDSRSDHVFARGCC